MKSFSELSEKLKKDKDDPCWKNYVQVGTKKKNGKEVPNCVPKEEVSEEKDEPASPDEGSMAKTQLEFIAYAAKEIEEHISSGGKFPEWMQNKLSGAHEKMKGLHASLGDHGGDDDEEEVKEATTGRAGVKCSGKKSQFGGYTPTCTRDGKGVYSAQQSYKDAGTAKKHAEVYADAYYAYGDRPAQKAVRDFVAKNKSKLHTKNESVEEGKLPPHLSKFFDKKGNLNKDAEERVKQGRKKRGLDPHTGKKLKSVREARRGDSAKDTYFDSYSSAISHALAQAKKKGYEVDEDDVFREITTGQGKPGRGKTVRHTLKLMKGGKPQKKALQIQVYNRETNKKTFELNTYIS